MVNTTPAFRGFSARYAVNDSLLFVIAGVAWEEFRLAFAKQCREIVVCNFGVVFGEMGPFLVRSLKPPDHRY